MKDPCHPSASRPGAMPPHNSVNHRSNRSLWRIKRLKRVAPIRQIKQCACGKKGAARHVGPGRPASEKNGSTPAGRSCDWLIMLRHYFIEIHHHQRSGSRAPSVSDWDVLDLAHSTYPV